MTEEYLTTRQMAIEAGVTPRFVLHYIDEKVLTPEIDNSRKIRKFSKKNLLELFLIIILGKSGFKVKQIKMIFDMIRKKNLDNRLDPIDEWGLTIGKEARLWIYKNWEDEILDVKVEDLNRYHKNRDLKYITIIEVNIESLFVYIDEM